MLLNIVTTLLQLVGMAVFATGAFFLTVWAGLLVTGVFLFLIGYTLEPSREVNDVP